MMVFSISFILIMAACGDEEAVEVSEVQADEKEETALLADNEIKAIIIDNLQQIDEVMDGIQEEYTHEWQGATWIDEPSVDQEKFDYAENIVREKLAHLATPSYLDSVSHAYLIQYFNWLDSFMIDEHSLDVRFQVLDQTEDQFVVQAIQLFHEQGYQSVGTNVLTYVKQDGGWKAHYYEYVNTDDEYLNLTFEDLEEYYGPGKIEFVEEVTRGNETYIVTKQDDIYEARNVRNSETDYEIADEYLAVNNEGTKYNTVTLEQNADWATIIAEYPEFGLEKIDAFMKSHVEVVYEERKARHESMAKEVAEYGIPHDYTYTIDDVFVTNSFVSVTFIDYAFEGGVHGNYMVRPINLDMKTLEEIKIQDIIKSEQQLAGVTQYISNKLEQRGGLFEDRVEEIASPNWDHVSTFRMTEDSIVFIYQPYEVGSFADGVIEVEVSIEELREL